MTCSIIVLALSAIMYPFTLQWLKCCMTITVAELWPWLLVFFLLVVFLCAANTSKSPNWINWNPFVNSGELFVFCLNKTQACPPGPGISIACDGVKEVISPYGPWIANVYKEDSCENVSSTLLPQFAACCQLLFLLPVSREQAATEASVVPLHSKTDFYFKNRLPEMFSNIPHRSERGFWQSGAILTYTGTLRPAEF